jgi:hypothetical protein
MPVKKPHSLINPWTSYEAMVRDDQTSGAGDGQLTLTELTAHIDRLRAQKDQLMSNEAGVAVIDLRIADARRLYKDMVDSGATALQYLPDPLMSLPTHLKQRASELLLHDDVGSVGNIDQFVIDNARQRYNNLGGSPISYHSRQKALQEIDQLAQALGLQ